jgi:hypothetical protein
MLRFGDFKERAHAPDFWVGQRGHHGLEIIGPDPHVTIAHDQELVPGFRQTA